MLQNFVVRKKKFTNKQGVFPCKNAYVKRKKKKLKKSSHSSELPLRPAPPRPGYKRTHWLWWGPWEKGAKAGWERGVLHLRERAFFRKECPQHSLAPGRFRLQCLSTRDLASSVLRQPGPPPHHWFFTSNFLASPVLEDTLDPNAARRVSFLEDLFVFCTFWLCFRGLEITTEVPSLGFVLFEIYIYIIHP